MNITKKDLVDFHNKMKEIWELPKVRSTEPFWEGVEIKIDERGELCIYCLSNDYNSRVPNRFYISADEINKPIEYFKKKFSDERKKYKRMEIKKQKEETKQKEISEKDEYERLKEKFEG